MSEQPHHLLGLNGAVLAGGGSRRMGRTKATLAWGDETLLQRACRVLAGVADRVTVVGRGDAIDLPLTRCGTQPETVCDDPRYAGPIAGVLAALESAPEAVWVVVGCDMPLFDVSAIRWLVAHHGESHDVTAARLPGRDDPEPLLAIYTGHAAPVVRAAAERGVRSMRRVIRELRTKVIDPPPELVVQWTNVNTPQELAELLRTVTPTSPG